MDVLMELMELLSKVDGDRSGCGYEYGVLGRIRLLQPCVLQRAANQIEVPSSCPADISCPSYTYWNHTGSREGDVRVQARRTGTNVVR